MVCVRMLSRRSTDICAPRQNEDDHQQVKKVSCHAHDSLMTFGVGKINLNYVVLAIPSCAMITRFAPLRTLTFKRLAFSL